MNDAIIGFNALAQTSRLSLLRYLIKTGPSGLAAGALGETLGISSSTLSFHLKELQRAGLIQARRHGRNIIYSAHYDGINTLVTFLMEDCCQGDARTCGPYIPIPACTTLESTNLRKD